MPDAALFERFDFGFLCAAMLLSIGTSGRFVLDALCLSLRLKIGKLPTRKSTQALSYLHTYQYSYPPQPTQQYARKREGGGEGRVSSTGKGGLHYFAEK